MIAADAPTMRALSIIALVFAIFAFDMSRNDGRLTDSVQNFAHALMRDIGLG
jgi:hypothetical protein